MPAEFKIALDLFDVKIVCFLCWELLATLEQKRLISSKMSLLHLMATEYLDNLTNQWQFRRLAYVGRELSVSF